MSLTAEQLSILGAVRRDERVARDGIVVGGAAMVLLGLKDKARDADVVLPELTFAHVVGTHLHDKGAVFNDSKGRLTLHGRGWDVSEHGDYATYYNGLDLLLPPNDELYTASYQELFENSKVVEGIMVVSPEQLLAWKRGMGREKDLADVALLEQSLGLQPVIPAPMSEHVA